MGRAAARVVVVTTANPYRVTLRNAAGSERVEIVRAKSGNSAAYRAEVAARKATGERWYPVRTEV